MKSNSGNCLDLIGQRFGRLTVVDRAEDKIDPKSGKHKTQWICNCDCGTTGYITIGAALTSGATRSCGCLHREVSRVNFHKEGRDHPSKKYNKYDLTGEYGIGYTTKDEEFYFDLEDYEKIKDICWHISSRGYLIGHIVGTKKTIKMHQLIMENKLKDGYIIDHINADLKNDNRKQNLRITTQDKNVLNRKRSKINKSGKTGVSYSKQKNKWLAYIRYQGVQYHLGEFIDKEDAIQARLDAEKKFFGEYQYIGEYA